jgi:hypothetical protein
LQVSRLRRRIIPVLFVVLKPHCQNLRLEDAFEFFEICISKPEYSKSLPAAPRLASNPHHSAGFARFPAYLESTIPALIVRFLSFANTITPEVLVPTGTSLLTLPAYPPARLAGPYLLVLPLFLLMQGRAGLNAKSHHPRMGVVVIPKLV